MTSAFVWKFNADGRFTIDQTPLPDCPLNTSVVHHVEDKWSAEGNAVTLAAGTPGQVIYEITINSDQLRFKAKLSDCISCNAVNTANPWKRVE